MKHFLLPAALILPGALIAQPIITQSNMPIVGDAATIGLCSDAVNEAALDAAAGAMQTWDFSSLSESSEEQFTFVDPATTPWASDFPGSDLCGIGWDGSHSYYITSASQLATEGNAFLLPGPPPEDTALVLLTGNTETILQLPFTFNDAHNDAFAGTIAVSGFNGTVDGTIDVSVDGYGTLILPNGTYTNVARYRFERTQNNTVMSFTTTTTKTQWGWVSPNHRFWLLLMEVNFDGFTTSDVVWYNKAPVLAGPSGIATHADASLVLAPNPVAAGQAVQLVNGMAGNTIEVELIDATGRIITRELSSSGRLSTTGLQPGIYLVRISEQQDALLRTARLIVQ